MLQFEAHLGIAVPILAVLIGLAFLDPMPGLCGDALFVVPCAG
jgi:hypothetical protein